MHEFRIEKRLAAGEAENADALGMRVFEEAQRDGDRRSRSGHSIGTQQCGQVKLHW